MRLLFYCILDFLCSLAICAFFDPFVLILVPFLLIFGFYWTKFNLKCLRELYRIEGIVRSPILNLTNEAIPGSKSRCTSLLLYGTKVLSSIQPK